MPRASLPHDLLLTFDFPPMGGGISRWMEALALGYPPGELIVSTGILPGWEVSDAAFPNRVDRVNVPSGRLKTLPGLWRWSRRVSALASEPTARFAWVANIRPAAYPARWALARRGLRYGVIVHGGDILTIRPKIARSRFKYRSMRSLLGSAAVIVANSEWSAAQCRLLLGDLRLPSTPERVRVVPLGTDPSRYHPNPAAAEAFRVRRGLPAGRWLLTVARLVPHKGIDSGIRLLAELAPQYPTLRYAIVGRGAYENDLQQLAASLGVADRVHILTNVTDSELPAAYAMADIYLGLSRVFGLNVEGFGISLIEAAASGLPVIAGASGGVPDAVADGESGMLVDPVDLREAADAVRRLLDDASLAKRFGDAGRGRVLRGFTWERVVNELRAMAVALGRP